MTHDFCPVMFYCRKCGIAMADAVNTGRTCTDAANVVGISHYVRRRAFGVRTGLDVDRMLGIQQEKPK